MSGEGAAPNNIAELPRLFGRPDESIRKLLEDVTALNETGQIDSIAIVTTSYGHIPQIRRRMGHTATTLLGALTTLAHEIAADAHREPIDTGGE